MNLRSIDLNLLVVLDALLDEAHVSRAAARLSLSQPAVSNALQRCRDLFDDPLLERGRGTMSRTPKAEAMRQPLKAVLDGVIDLVDPQEIALKDISQVIRITIADDPMSMVATELMAELRECAPGIRIVFKPWRGGDQAARDLRNGDADLAVAVFTGENEDLEIIEALRETYVIAMRYDHPAASEFSLDSWLAWPHVVVSGTGELRTPLDAQLQTIGRKRQVGAVVSAFHLVPQILAASDLIAMIPNHSLAHHLRPDLISFPPPIPVDGFPLHIAWHRRNSRDSALKFLVGVLGRIFFHMDKQQLTIHEGNI